MFWRRLIKIWLYLAMVLLSAGPASAVSSAQAKPHQGSAELSVALHIWLEASASAEVHTGNVCLSGADTSDVPHAARGASEVPTMLARVIPGKGPFPTFGPPGRADVFVTAAEDIAGMNPSQIAERLTIPESSSYTVVRFSTPSEGLASPVLRTDPGFVGGGYTAGGAREFVLPNGPIPSGASIQVITW
jgi:Novel toxin 10